MGEIVEARCAGRGRHFDAAFFMANFFR